MYSKTLAIPYQGSKRLLAPKIIDFLASRHPEKPHLYDFFGGGGAISLNAAKAKKFIAVTYVDHYRGLVSLLQLLVNGNSLPTWISTYVDKDLFNKSKNIDSAENVARSILWSFGTAGKSYYANPRLADEHKIIYSYLVFGLYAEQMLGKYKFELPYKDFVRLDAQDRRLKWVRHAKKHGFLACQLQPLERMAHLERIAETKFFDLEIFHADYRDFHISEGKGIIYADPPYEGTAGYKGKFDHEEFYAWVKAQKVPTYFSSYNNISDRSFEPVFEVDRFSTFSKSGRRRVVETLYFNRIFDF